LYFLLGGKRKYERKAAENDNFSFFLRPLHRAFAYAAPRKKLQVLMLAIRMQTEASAFARIFGYSRTQSKQFREPS
jgi:hypothetical protein